MSYEIVTTEVAEQPIASVRTRANMDNLVQQIMGGFDLLYKAIGDTDIGERGRNVVLYHDDPPGAFMSHHGIEIEVGIELPGHAPLPAPVEHSMLPAGRVVQTTHIGAYSGLIHAHRAVQEWCRKNGYSFTGKNWETYGHWTDNESQLRTDVCYLVH